MRKFIYRLLGWECCGEWTQWVRKTQNYERLTDMRRDGLAAVTTDKVEYTRVWQERTCTLCGRLQQKELKF